MTPERRAEADKAATTFHLALTALGAEAVQDALVFWEENPPGASPAVSTRWLNGVVRLVAVRRQRTRRLARAYYRLIRALHTNTTIADPVIEEPSEVPLSKLRDEFARVATRASQAPSEPSATRTPDEPQEGADGRTDPVADEPEGDDEDDRILVEELARIDEEEVRIERAAVEEARIALAALGAENQRRLEEAIDRERAAEEVDRLRQEAHDKAGARQAAAAERLVLDGARSTLWNASENDQRVIGWVRLSRTGTPCGWCAMLISRGAVYRSEKSASGTYKDATDYSDGDRYHDNCRCYAMPVFSRAQFNDSDLFALNRQYAEEWPNVTKGLSGKAAVSAWRYYIRQQQKSLRDRASRNTTNVQEA